MEDKEIIAIANNIISTDINTADYYSNSEYYDKVKAYYISHFKNEEVTKYSFEANRDVWDEYTDDTSKKFLEATLREFIKDTTNIGNRLDLVSALIIMGCEF